MERLTRSSQLESWEGTSIPIVQDLGSEGQLVSRWRGILAVVYTVTAAPGPLKLIPQKEISEAGLVGRPACLNVGSGDAHALKAVARMVGLCRAPLQGSNFPLGHPGQVHCKEGTGRRLE